MTSFCLFLKKKPKELIIFFIIRVKNYNSLSNFNNKIISFQYEIYKRGKYYFIFHVFLVF